LDFDKHIGSLLAVMVSLRLLVLVFDDDEQCPVEDVLAFITKVSDLASRLEYFNMCHEKDSYWKRIGGQWVICDETEFTSLVL
jgi:hypothetical protein